MSGYTYLNHEEKLQSVVYMSEHMMVSREELREKEIEIMEVFLENFIKESDYDKLTIFSVKFNQGVYYIEWASDCPCIEYYDNGIKNFIDHMEKYKAISKAITKKVSSLKYPNSFQLDLQVNFPKYVDYWWMHDVESTLFEVEHRTWMSPLKTMEPEYFTGEDQCEELWKNNKKDSMIGNGNLYFDGFHEMALKRLKLEKLIERNKFIIKYTAEDYDDEEYEDLKGELESLKINEKILEDGIHEMLYRMKGRDLSIRLKDWRMRITQNPFKGMSKRFAREMPQQLLEYFDTAKMDFRRWIEEIING